MLYIKEINLLAKGKWECKNYINGHAVYYYQFKKKYRINSFLMQELKNLCLFTSQIRPFYATH
jgi:hypothetical protein